MQIENVYVGQPRAVLWQGKSVLTSIYKHPIQGEVVVDPLNLAGDGQADLTVHGGVDKAVYTYPIEHYSFWRHQLPEVDLVGGIFGENLTTSGLLEETVAIGDLFRFGSALLMAKQPRLPCFKLGIRFGDMQMVKRFQEAQRTGIYFSVVQPGVLAAGDRIERIAAHPQQVPITEITRLYLERSQDPVRLQALLRVEELPQNWRDYFQERLERMEEKQVE
ncbi:MAG: MOSC domain-containing protein [Cyanobacteriota bacterium]|nr:MOSC domain-containing protein [Cyanobacteriota bacterium]